jgi:WD40 repeat protein
MLRVVRTSSLAGFALFIATLGGGRPDDLAAPKPQELIDVQMGLQSVSVSADGTHAAIGGSDSYEVRLTPLKRPRVTRVISLSRPPGVNRQRVHVALPPRGNGLAVASDLVPDDDIFGDRARSRLEIWDTSTGQLRACFGEWDCALQSIDFSPDGSTLAAGDSDGKVILWNVATGKGETVFSSRPVRDHFRPIRTVRFSPSGAQLVWSQAEFLNQEAGESIQLDGSIWFWDTDSRTKPVRVSVDREDPSALAFSGDGKHLASGSTNGRVRVWDAPNRKQETEVLAKGAWIDVLAVSKDGQFVVFGGRGERLYFAVVSQLRISLELNVTRVTQRETGFVKSILFTPDGCRLIVGWTKSLRESVESLPQSKILVYNCDALREAMK